MSRHELPARANDDGVVRVVLGWDPPLETFFALAYRKEDEHDEEDWVAAWQGASFREVPDAAAIVRAVEIWADVPADIIEQLRADRAEDR